MLFIITNIHLYTLIGLYSICTALRLYKNIAPKDRPNITLIWAVFLKNPIVFFINMLFSIISFVAIALTLGYFNLAVQIDYSNTILYLYTVHGRLHQIRLVLFLLKCIKSRTFDLEKFAFPLSSFIIFCVFGGISYNIFIANDLNLFQSWDRLKNKFILDNFYTLNFINEYLLRGVIKIISTFPLVGKPIYKALHNYNTIYYDHNSSVQPFRKSYNNIISYKIEPVELTQPISRFRGFIRFIPNPNNLALEQTRALEQFYNNLYILYIHLEAYKYYINLKEYYESMCKLKSEFKPNINDTLPKITYPSSVPINTTSKFKLIQANSVESSFTENKVNFDNLTLHDLKNSSSTDKLNSFSKGRSDVLHKEMDLSINILKSYGYNGKTGLDFLWNFNTSPPSYLTDIQVFMQNIESSSSNNPKTTSNKVSLSYNDFKCIIKYKNSKPNNCYVRFELNTNRLDDISYIQEIFSVTRGKIIETLMLSNADRNIVNNITFNNITVENGVHIRHLITAFENSFYEGDLTPYLPFSDNFYLTKGIYIPNNVDSNDLMHYNIRDFTYEEIECLLNLIEYKQLYYLYSKGFFNQYIPNLYSISNDNIFIEIFKYFHLIPSEDLCKSTLKDIGITFNGYLLLENGSTSTLSDMLSRLFILKFTFFGLDSSQSSYKNAHNIVPSTNIHDLCNKLKTLLNVQLSRDFTDPNIKTLGILLKRKMANIISEHSDDIRNLGVYSSLNVDHWVRDSSLSKIPDCFLNNNISVYKSRFVEITSTGFKTDKFTYLLSKYRCNTMNNTSFWPQDDYFYSNNLKLPEIYKELYSNDIDITESELWSLKKDLTDIIRESRESKKTGVYTPFQIENIRALLAYFKVDNGIVFNKPIGVYKSHDTARCLEKFIIHRKDLYLSLDAFRSRLLEEHPFLRRKLY